MRLGSWLVALALLSASPFARADVDPLGQQYMDQCVASRGPDLPPQQQSGGWARACNNSTGTLTGTDYNYSVSVSNGQFQIDQNVNFNYSGNEGERGASQDAVSQAAQCASQLYQSNGLNVVFHVTFETPSGNGLNLRLSDGSDRSNANSFNILHDQGVDLSPDQQCGFVAHEMGHHLQMPDEYSEPTFCPDRDTIGPIDDTMRNCWIPTSQQNFYAEDIVDALHGVCGSGPPRRQITPDNCYEGYTFNTDTFTCDIVPAVCGPGFDVEYNQCTCLGPLTNLPDGSCGVASPCGPGFEAGPDGCACSPPATVGEDGSCSGAPVLKLAACNMGGDSCGWSCGDGADSPPPMVMGEDGSCTFAPMFTPPACPYGIDEGGGCLPPPGCSDGGQPDEYGSCPSCPFGSDGNGGCSEPCPDGSDPTYGCAVPPPPPTPELVPPVTSPECSADEGNCIPLGSTTQGEGDTSNDLAIIPPGTGETETSFNPESAPSTGDGGSGDGGSGDPGYGSTYTYSSSYSENPSYSYSSSYTYNPPDTSSYTPPDTSSYTPPDTSSPDSSYTSYSPSYDTSSTWDYTGGY